MKILNAIFIITIFLSVIFNLVTTELIREPRGDEPHYLVITLSLLKDHDLDLKNNYDQGDYHEYYKGEIDRHVNKQKNGQEFSTHDILIGVLAAIPYAVAKVTGVRVFVAILFGLSVFFFYLILKNLFPKSQYNIAFTFIYAMTPLFFAYSVQIFPDMLVALFLEIALLLSLRKYKYTYLLIGLISIPLIFLHFKSVVAYPGLLLFTYFSINKNLTLTALKDWRIWLPKTTFTMLFMIVAILMLSTFNYFTLHRFDPFASQISGSSKLTTDYLGKGFIFSVFDGQAGLIFTAPTVLIGLFNICNIKVWKVKLSLFLSIMAIITPFIIIHTSYLHWFGGWASWGRYWVIVYPSLTILFIYWFEATSPIFKKLFISAFYIYALLAVLVLPFISFGYPSVRSEASLYLIMIRDYFNVNIINVAPIFIENFGNLNAQYIKSFLWFLVYLFVFLLGLNRSDILKK